ncbi:MAG: SAF domain-containing protein [Acetobacteraceae bacterium]|jgi:hypothetical protein
MTIRGLLALAYCIALTLGVWWIVQRNDLTTMDFVATRDLALNQMLQKGDIQAAAWNRIKSVEGTPNADQFIGRYVRGPLPKGAALRLEATDTVPNLAVVPGHLTLLSSLPRSMAAGINAGTCVRLNSQDQTVFRVQAILCPLNVAAECSAVIDIPAPNVNATTAGGAALAVMAATDCK